MNEENSLKLKNSIPLDILFDLITRFIIFVPQEWKENLIRICFQIELAYWYYLDFYVQSDSTLNKCSITHFARHIFQHAPSLQPLSANVSEVIQEFQLYKKSIPTYGAIILSEDASHVLLVKGYSAKSTWGFPKGKVNQEEDPSRCAIREVLEETGFDITNFINKNLFLESKIREQFVRLYIITGVPRNTTFHPRTRNEIKACEWFLVADLPNKNDKTPKVKTGINPNSFFMVMPFVKRIKAFLNRQQKSKQIRQKSNSVREDSVETTSKGKFKPVVRSSSSNVGDKTRKRSIEQKNLHPKKQLCNESVLSWLNFKFDMTALKECFL